MLADVWYFTHNGQYHFDKRDLGSTLFDAGGSRIDEGGTYGFALLYYAGRHLILHPQCTSRIDEGGPYGVPLLYYAGRHLVLHPQ